jgi:hypothetical protein
VGLLCDYFLAPDDEAAAQTADWTGGPGDPPPSSDRLPTVSFKSMEPVVSMSTLENLFTGTPVDDLITAAAVRDVAMRDEGELMVFRISDTLKEELAKAPASRLSEVGKAWAATEEFSWIDDARYVTEALTALAELARQDTAGTQHLYCWVCV